MKGFLKTAEGLRWTDVSEISFHRGLLIRLALPPPTIRSVVFLNHFFARDSKPQQDAGICVV